MSVLATVRRVGWATVQDGGRHGYTDIGVPTSGAWHRGRYLLAASLLGGTEPSPAIEILAGPLSLAFDEATVLAVSGPAAVAIDGRRGPLGAVMAVARGSEVAVEPEGRGPVYVVIGGWRPPVLLGSASTDTFSRLGGALLAVGDRVFGAPEPWFAQRVGAFHRAISDAVGPLRVVPTGMCDDHDLESVRWPVLSTSRSGVRLSGGVAGASAVTPSAPMLPGAIQITPGGEAIILGPDGGLTGGYPVIGVVATVDRDRVSLLAPGEDLRLRVVTPSEAAAARADQVRRLSQAIAHPGQLP